MLRTLTFFFLLVCLTSGLTAQENLVKINPFGLGFKSLTLGYERVMNDRQSLAVNFNLQLGTPSFIKNSVENEISVDGGDGSIHLTGFAITPQFRTYVSRKGAPTGFYVSPYLRYTHRKLNVVATYDGETTDVDFIFRGPGVGFQMGVQWIIEDKVCIDWYFFGIGINYTTFKGIYTASEIGDIDDINDEIQAELDGIPYVGSRVKVDSNANTLTARFGSFIPALRSGISVGYFF